MKEKDLKTLIERYFEGETNLEEERMLKEHFTIHAPVGPEQIEIATWLKFVKTEQQVVVASTENAPKLEVKSGGLNRQWRRWAWAATLLLGMSVTSWYLHNQWRLNQKQIAARQRLYEDHYDDPQKALAEVKAALALVSKKMHKGQKATHKGLAQVKRLAIVK